MLRLDTIIKPWRESAALNAHINLYGFWNDTTFLTKSGDVGMVLRVTGVDYESLDRSEQEYAVKRLEAALSFHGFMTLSSRNITRPPRGGFLALRRRNAVCSARTLPRCGGMPDRCSLPNDRRQSRR